MENANSENQKSRRWIFMLIALAAILAAAGVWFYQSSQQATDDTAVEIEFVNAEQETENAEVAEQQKQPQKKAVAQKKESGSMLDKIKDIDLEVRGAKNPCTQTERMMKQCTD